MRKGMTALIIGAALMFSQSVMSNEMIRYEHEMFATPNERPAFVPAREPNHTKREKQRKEIRQAKSKQGHPVYTAFPDRD